jgi:hypothetical protein
MREGLLAEFTEPEALVAAIRAMRDKGYHQLDAYTPYPVEQAEEALRVRRTRLPIFIFVVGISAAGGAYFLQWFLTAYLYPLNVGGRPPHMPLAYVLITFEMGVLFAAFAAFFGLLFRARLVRLWHPVFEVEGFERASIDRFWLAVGADDSLFDGDKTVRELDELGALRVVPFGRRAS